MKFKKGILLIALTLVIVSITSAFTSVQAQVGTRTLSIKALRKSGYGYQFVNNSTEYIWKIYDTNNDVNETFYCMKGGAGFGSNNAETDGAIVPTTYTKSFNLKDPGNISDKYKSPLIDPTTKDFERLIWVLDQCYVQPKTNASDAEKNVAKKNKQALLDAVEKYANDNGDIYENTSSVNNKLTDNLTEDDIDALQQLAVWYYTNKGDNFHVETNPSIRINSVKNIDGNYQPLNINNDEQLARVHAMNALYDYLTKTPQETNFSYDYKNSTKTDKPVQFSNTTVQFDTSGTRVIVGPYKIEEVRDIEYTLKATYTDGNGNEIKDVKLLDSNKAEVAQGTTLKDLVGKEFYISVSPTTNITNLKFNISGEFFITETTYWNVENPTQADQPVVQLEKKIVEFEDNKEDGKEPEPELGEFDLALRKFITSVAGVELTGADSRVPQISNETLRDLANGGILTLQKVHSKTPLVVKKGEKIVYTIRVYNEGEVDGWATEVTDYLPTGLKFVPKTESTINNQYGWELEAGTNKVTTNYLADEAHKIKAFNKTTLDLDYEDLQIECEVIANTKKDDQTFKNIAEITANKDVEGRTDSDLDRDSQVKNVTTDPSKYNPKDVVNGLGEQDDDDFEDVILKGQYFDLALRKFITSVAGVELTGADSRVPKITEDALRSLANGGTLTVTKTHTKTPIVVKKGDKVIYTIRIYNEGELDGWATEVTDYLPAGLKFVPKTESTINNQYGWELEAGTNKVTTNYLADEAHKLTAFNKTTLDLDYEDLQIECEVIASIAEDDQILKNIAEITANKDINGNTNVDLDRDSQVKNVTTDTTKYNPKDPENGLGEQDDDDYEDLLLKGKYFDLALRKFITSVTNPNKQTPTIIESREPVVDVTPLKNGNRTAIYKHTKQPVGVTNGDIVTYTIRVYNEGQIDGYVKKITDHLPEQLEFIVTDELNAKYGWTIDPNDPRSISTNITSPETEHSANRDIIFAGRNTGSDADKVLLKAFNGTNLDYIDVQIRCRVKEKIDLYEKITNIAEITEYSNESNIIDRDSTQDSLTNDNSKPKDDIQDDNLPEDTDLPEYKGNTTNKTDLSDKDYFYKGQQDDDDFEKLVLQRFDLALRKFITGVVKGEKTTEIKNRAPIFKKVNDLEYTYEHSKDPVDVAYGNTVIYTLRIFNEGNIAGYATRVKDDIPEGLEFLPNNSINDAFDWKMYKEDGTETKNVKEAKYIETDFLSKEKEEKEGANLINAFDTKTMTMPDHKDLKIAFKVIQPNTSKNTIINKAQISEDSDKDGDPVDDVDSKPNEWNEGEDDQDTEEIKVKYFDLSLKKWVTESIVTCDGKTVKTKSGHTGDENPEPPMKVEIQTGKLNKTTVKFKYKIRVKNEGDIPGYATELIDYIPEGLKFEQKDNPKWKVEDNKVITDQLKDTLLEPGDSATVEIILTWINGKNNMGEKVNWAEINEDKNEDDSPDIDSTPGNNVKDEDDIDQAPVLLSPATGSSQTYVLLTLSCVTVIMGGVFLIKKFVI